VNWIALAVMLAPVYVILALVGWMAYKAGEKAEAVLERIEKIETVDDFAGTIHWPIDTDDWLMDGLREEAGDEDDTKRQQLEAVVRIADWRH
jgi:hypothetical protein